MKKLKLSYISYLLLLTASAVMCRQSADLLQMLTQIQLCKLVDFCQPLGKQARLHNCIQLGISGTWLLDDVNTMNRN